MHDYGVFFEQAHAVGAFCIVAADILGLALLRPPGEFGADVAVGVSQRFGVPPGYGGPHAGFLATKDTFKRQMPGRLVGVSKDAQGDPAMRLALGTREQHIRRDKATSNICTAQVLLAVMASMYAVYHGPDGLRRIARRTKLLTEMLASGLRTAGAKVSPGPFFDTLTVSNVAPERVHAAAEAKGFNLRRIDASRVGISLDEATTTQEVKALLAIFGSILLPSPDSVSPDFASPHGRTSPYLTAAVFQRYHTEHEMLRYIKRLEAKDLTLCQSMISLGSCTMKLNAASELFPVSWPEFSRLHPLRWSTRPAATAGSSATSRRGLPRSPASPRFRSSPTPAPRENTPAFSWFAAAHESRRLRAAGTCASSRRARTGRTRRARPCAGMTIVPSPACDAQGNIDVTDLRAKAKAHADDLAALMVTYPSTHGVFESAIKDICEVVHAHGGQVYMDGANMNAQVGLTSPGHIGADVCHLNLHKTFCIPHGGGGPGMGPIGVASHLAPYLPGHAVVSPFANDKARRHLGAVSAAPWGSRVDPAVISWMYIRMMGADGLTRATKNAILNANYIAKRLAPSTSRSCSAGPRAARGAHECIVDLRGWKKHGVEAGRHRQAPHGLRFPRADPLLPGSRHLHGRAHRERVARRARSLLRRDDRHPRRGSAQGRANGEWPKTDNPLKNAPHTAKVVCATRWTHPYSRETAAYPAAWLRERKFWPSVGRIDGAYGDRNFFCSCSALS